MVSDNLLSFAANNYGFDKGTLHFISESTNQIYSFQKDGKWYILRFSERPSEQIRQTKAEMDWLYYLANNKIGVSLLLAAEYRMSLFLNLNFPIQKGIDRSRSSLLSIKWINCLPLSNVFL